MCGGEFIDVDVPSIVVNWEVLVFALALGITTEMVVRRRGNRGEWGFIYEHGHFFSTTLNVGRTRARRSFY